MIIAGAIATPRLKLVPLTVDLVDALIAGDAAELKHATGAEFPVPFALPPLFDRDALAEIREHLDRGAHGYESYMLVLKEDPEPVGIAGLSPTGETGASMLGYSIYKDHQGDGYATEAAVALIRQAFDNGARMVRATIPNDSEASIRVAEKAGMAKAATAHDEDAGEVLVFETTSG